MRPKAMHQSSAVRCQYVFAGNGNTAYLLVRCRRVNTSMVVVSRVCRRIANRIAVSDNTIREMVRGHSNWMQTPIDIVLLSSVCW